MLIVYMVPYFYISLFHNGKYCNLHLKAQIFLLKWKYNAKNYLEKSYLKMQRFKHFDYYRN